MAESIDDLVRFTLAAADVDLAISRVASLSRFDRYQASAGIESAAYLVAEWAETSGLENVSVKLYPADGSTRWWTFASPVAWTPTVARATLLLPNGLRIEVADHIEDPFALATYSSPPQGNPRRYPLIRADNINATPVDAVAFGVDHRLAHAFAGRVAGFLSATPAKRDRDGTFCAGRIELSPHSGQFAFSISPETLALVAGGASDGALIEIDIEIDKRAMMPVVSGILPGDGDERWVLSHLCHPRPGANDNASGVAASLAVAKTLADHRRRGYRPATSPTRFLWGPEFLGTAATLHESASPAAVINLDMVGEDQALCDSPFVIERAPDRYGTRLNALADATVAAVFQRTNRKGDRWLSVPFHGFSDHCLFADASVARPALQFCHPWDKFNHSAADTIDKISALEMRRSVAAAASLLAICDAGEPAEVEAIIDRWGREQLLSMRLAASTAANASEDWKARVEEYGQALSSHASEIARGNSQEFHLPARATIEPGSLRRNWHGPVNVRAMLQALPDSSRIAAARAISESKTIYSWVLGFGLLVNGQRTACEIMDTLSLDSRVLIDRERLLEIASWYREAGFTLSDDEP